MDAQLAVAHEGEHVAIDALLAGALLLDLEVSHRGKILKVGAICGKAKLARSGSTPLDLMTIRFHDDSRAEKYKVSDYQPLAHHYKERILQVHVMGEYARLGLERIQAALSLVLDYFRLPKEDFIRRYFRAKPDLLEYATTARSYQRIVTDLDNSDQTKIVTAPPSRNMLILAGPGSGKTRTVVHRCAYLLRVERVRPQNILVCCFNRNAAIQLRRRLQDLVGDDSRGVAVLTYHALAMRLLGFSYSRSTPAGRDIDFDALITDATKHLQGEHAPHGLEPDEVRDRLLAGFQYILVDEYQDIDEPQYNLISAIAGRTLEDADLKLSILAVGDDDQNIYTFRGANVRFIHQFQQDYSSEAYYLVENYRSTRHIIDTANHLIAANRDRMKTDHPIRIDRHRQMLPPGGEFSTRDPLHQGKVQVIEVANSGCQAQAVIAELRRLRQLGVSDWSSIAVLSREHADLAAVRSLAERESIPIRWIPARTAIPALHHIRELHQFLGQLNNQRSSLKRASDLLQLAQNTFASKTNIWTQFLFRTLESWRTESADSEIPVQDALEFLYEACSESRREFTYGDGVTLCTVHSAKGTEFDHVLVIGPWRPGPNREKQEEERRTFYVALTRARKTLAVFDRADVRPSLAQTLTNPNVISQQFRSATAEPPERAPNYQVLSLEEINLGYAGMYPPYHKLHSALSALQPGDKLSLKSTGTGIGLFDHSNTCVSRLSRKAEPEWRGRLPSIREARVLAMIHRTADQDPEPIRRTQYKSPEWEIPIVEVVYAQEPAVNGVSQW